jgi:hypothetical protein
MHSIISPSIPVSAHPVQYWYPHSKCRQSHILIKALLQVSGICLVKCALKCLFDFCAPAAVYLIFGATGGIGSALAQRLAKHEGAALVLAGRNQDKLSALSNSLSAKPAGGVSTLVCDVTDSKAVEQAVEQAVQAHGSVSGVVNCVGSIVLKAAHQTSGERQCRGMGNLWWMWHPQHTGALKAGDTFI